jgi:hypothetical protein
MTETIRAKWTMDGATTLPEAAAKLRAFADELDRMHAEGYRLERPVEDDYGDVLAPGEEPGSADDDWLGELEAKASLLEAELGEFRAQHRRVIGYPDSQGDPATDFNARP